MKLILCPVPACLDVFKLAGGAPRACRCGASSGRYLDEKRVEVSGPALVLGIDNAAFEAAYRRWTETGGTGAQVSLFFLPEGAATVERREKRRRAG
jgi:hypothetical protein